MLEQQLYLAGAAQEKAKLRRQNIRTASSPHRRVIILIYCVHILSSESTLAVMIRGRSSTIMKDTIVEDVIHECDNCCH